jgi:hypothetical protein
LPELQLLDQLWWPLWRLSRFVELVRQVRLCDGGGQYV